MGNLKEGEINIFNYFGFGKYAVWLRKMFSTYLITQKQLSAETSNMF